ncbi:MAG: PepSY domain-containing protein [Pseudomonadales bacterium]
MQLNSGRIRALVMGFVVLLLGSQVIAQQDTSSISEAQAIELAQKKASERVISAQLGPLSGEDASQVYKIKLLSDQGVVRMVVIRADTGKDLAE